MPVVIALVAFAYRATLYLSIVFVTWHRSAPQCGTSQRRGKVVYTSSQGEERHFALNQRETIVGVGDTTKGMYFYIGTDVLDEHT
jgi:hypothetical protein